MSPRARLGRTAARRSAGATVPLERTTTRRSKRRRHDHGSAAAELVVLTPMLIAFALVIAFAGRAVMSWQQVSDAARTSLDAAVVQQSPPAAADAAAVTAFEELQADGLRCSPYAVATDTAAFAPGGRVSVEVTCGIAFVTLGLGDVPASVTLSAGALAAIEPYRAVG